jgi:hypothetical protein
VVDLLGSHSLGERTLRQGFSVGTKRKALPWQACRLRTLRKLQPTRLPLQKIDNQKFFELEADLAEGSAIIRRSESDSHLIPKSRADLKASFD